MGAADRRQVTPRPRGETTDLGKVTGTTALTGVGDLLSREVRAPARHAPPRECKICAVGVCVFYGAVTAKARKGRRTRYFPQVAGTLARMTTSCPPPDTDLRRARRAHFEGFAGLLTPSQRRVVEQNYVGGRYGRSRRTPARDRVLLHKALRRLAELGVELELPPATWGANGTEEWVDDDRVQSRCCDVCGHRYDAELAANYPGKALPSQCLDTARTEAQARAHGTRYRPGDW